MFAGAMDAAKDAMANAGGETPEFDAAEAEGAINEAAASAEAEGGKEELVTKLKAAATNPKIQGAFMDVKNNGVAAATKYASDPEITSILKGVFMG
eukprot:CAMPEP_0119266506 /NCGR_PEP_ID=MMETSP1329-20130426/4975_1 /TAXON_ID=114041 /ORGANISM="Genus nov. species nov., Strain RCC1024" /LENGTH=95 /DNA_ID=CAMNT_0007266389 /DNA_START=100 /DNA_END=387 /DNA_ORIENTATION=+